MRCVLNPLPPSFAPASPPTFILLHSTILSPLSSSISLLFSSPSLFPCYLFVLLSHPLHFLFLPHPPILPFPHLPSTLLPPLLSSPLSLCFSPLLSCPLLFSSSPHLSLCISPLLSSPSSSPLFSPYCALQPSPLSYPWKCQAPCCAGRALVVLSCCLFV